MSRRSRRSSVSLARTTVNLSTGSAAEARISKMLEAMINSRRVRPDSLEKTRLRARILHLPSTREANKTKITLFASRKGYKSGGVASTQQVRGAHSPRIDWQARAGEATRDGAASASGEAEKEWQ